MKDGTDVPVNVTLEGCPEKSENGKKGTVKASTPLPRCISKEGKVKFRIHKAEGVLGRLFGDIFTSLLDLKWRWTLLTFCCVYFGSWIIFAFFWFSILYFNGDFMQQPSPKPCISGIQNFAAVFLFSVETQHTTGYGFYQISDECPVAIMLMCLQSIVGVILEGICVGVVFIKITRAKKRRATLLFSKNAVVSTRDGKLCLMFRVGDFRTRSHLLHTQVRARVIRRRTTVEGEVIRYHQQELLIDDQTEKSNKIYLFWPHVVAHVLDESSPLFNMKPSDLTTENTSFEIMVALEGIVESTGLTVQARSSYLPCEILWGHRFQDVHLSKSDQTGERVLDYSKFHETYPATIVCAALENSSL